MESLLEYLLQRCPRPPVTPIPHDFLPARGDGAVDAPVEDLGIEGVGFPLSLEVVRVGRVGEVVLGWGEGGAVDGVWTGFVAVGEDLVGSEGGAGWWRGGGGCGVVVERCGYGQNGFHMVVVVDARRGGGEEGAGHGRLSGLPLCPRSHSVQARYTLTRLSLSDSAGPYRE